MATKKKRPGRVVRFNEKAFRILEVSKQHPDESASEILLRLVEGASGTQVYYILPKSKIVCDSLAEAKGLAILEAVKRGEKRPTEKPVKVKEQL